MNLLCIDLGNYSVKFLKTRDDRRNFNFNEIHEVPIAEASELMDENISIDEVQMEIISRYLEESEYEGKIIFQLPNTHTSSRFLSLPTTNKRKAELIIPFQLEEEIPFPVSNIHHVSILRKQRDHIQAIVNFSPLQDFDDYHTALSESHLLPNVLTSEICLMQNFILNNGLKGHYAILDLGHQNAKAYFIKDQTIVSAHYSPVAGRLITEVIAETYNISIPEAEEYKHQNCFLLTEGQFKEVDEDQKEFAKLMNQTYLPLIMEFKRWELGFRVKQGVSIEKIYVTGGSSLISNTENFLTQHLGLKVEPVNIKVGKKLVGKGDEASTDPQHDLLKMMAVSQVYGDGLPNLLTGPYAGGATSNIPLHSSFFLGTRVFIVALIIILSLLVENIFLDKKNDDMTRSLSNIMRKRRELEISRPKISRFRRDPTNILKLMRKKLDSQKQELKIIDSSQTVNALSPLAELSKLLSANKSIDLTFFESDSVNVIAKFSSASPNYITKMKEYLDGLSLPDKKITYKKGSRTLELRYKKEQ